MYQANSWGLHRPRLGIYYFGVPIVILGVHSYTGESRLIFFTGICYFMTFTTIQFGIFEGGPLGILPPNGGLYRTILRALLRQMFLIFKNSFLTIKGPRCFLKRKGSFHPPANSKVKEARTMKLCTVIVYYIVSIIKQLKFRNSHYSIVCSHCSVICLVIKMGQKMVEFSSS